jgi:hypothetical protein
MDMMLSYLAGYGVDHHSRAMGKILPVMIDRTLPNVGYYIGSRLLQTDAIAKFKKGMLKKDDTPGISVASFWHDQVDIDDMLQPAPIEQELKLEFVDIPNIHTFTEEIADELMSSLAGTEDMELFN